MMRLRLVYLPIGIVAVILLLQLLNYKYGSQRSETQPENAKISYRCQYISEAHTTSSSFKTYRMFRVSNAAHDFVSGVFQTPCLKNSSNDPLGDPNLQIQVKHIISATIVQDGNSWGRNRSFEGHFLKLASYNEQDPPVSLQHSLPVSVGLLISDLDEYLAIVDFLERVFVRNIRLNPKEETILEKLNLQTLFIIYSASDSEVTYENRHFNHLQRSRRKNIARYRNQLIAEVWKHSILLPNPSTIPTGFSANTLKEPTHFMWSDADVIRIPDWDDIAVMASREDGDIVAVRCEKADFGEDYDLNTWKGPRGKPSEEQLLEFRAGKFDYVPHPIDGNVFITHFRTPKSEFEKIDQNFNAREAKRRRKEIAWKNWVELDSVGGTFLIVKSHVFKDGIMFPPMHVIGTEWETVDGWDGVETEGLCYIARSVGYKCWGLPDISSEHD